MSNIKISELTSASGLTGAELIPIVQENTTVKTTAQAIADLAGGGGAISFNIAADGTVVSNAQNVSIKQGAIISNAPGNQTITADTYPEVYMGGGNSTTVTITNLPAASFGLSNFSNLVTLSFPDLATIKFGGMIAFSVNGCASLTTINIPVLTTVPSGAWYSLDNNALSQATVDDILVKFAASGATNGSLYLNGGTNATPSATGLTAKATLLSRGWTVSTN